MSPRHSPTLLGALVVRGGTVLDAGGERRADVVITDGVVTEVGPSLKAPARSQVLDASGCLVMPGLVDLHAHLRQPGGEQAETIETGARAAALGGYTAIMAMPNTEPAIDSAEVVAHVLEMGRVAAVEVLVAGAITLRRAGKRLAPMAEMAALGVRVFTDDGHGVQDPLVMRRAFEYASGLGVILAQHCEDDRLAAGGHMNEGEWSSRLGIPGIPAEAETVMVARDIALARLTGGRLHLLHLSVGASVELVRAAKAENLAVTAEVAPHHLCLTDAMVAGYDPVFKVNPPLRGEQDVMSVRAGLAEGVIDAIATDHAPHAPETKEAPFEQAPPGMLGLETALSLVWGEIGPGSSEPAMTPGALLAVMSWNPARIAGLWPRHGGPIQAGSSANLCIFDPSQTWTVNAHSLASRSHNTPYAGRSMVGRVR
ncbi:MAG: dihydroorotase, partial [Acidimicrobiales bacterium]